MDGKHRLAQLKLVVDELHSRRDDGLNDFGRDEPAVGRLLRSLDSILGQQTQSPGDAWQFLTAALQSVKASSLVLDTLKRVESRNLASTEESFRLWIVFALSTPCAMVDTLRDVLRMPDLIVCFYLETSPLNDPLFIEALTPVVASIFAHPLHGHITYKLDVSCLPLFTAQEEIIAVRRRGTTTVKKAAATTPTAAAAATAAAAPSAAPKPKRSFRVAPGSPTAVDPDAALVMHDSGSESVGPSSVASSYVDPTPMGHIPSAAPPTAPAASTASAGTAGSLDESQQLAATAPAQLTHSATTTSVASQPHGAVLHHRIVHRPKSPAPVVKVSTSDGCSQTDPPPVPPPAPLLVTKETNTEEREPIPYSELKRLEKLLVEREKVNTETRARLEKTEEELEEIREDLNDQLDNVTAALKNIKNLYNHHFMLSKDAQDSGKPIDRSRVDVLFTRIIAVLNGADPVAPLPAAQQTTMHKSASFAGSAAGARPAAIAIGGGGRGARDDESDSSESAIMVASGGATFGSADPSPRNPPPAGGIGRTASFNSVASEQNHSTRLRAESFVGADGGRQRGMSVLPPPDAVPAITRGKRPWRLELLVEAERTKQLDVQQYKCAGCGKDLPNPNNSNMLARAFQRTQKPRRCHYSGELFCHDCHSNKKHALPFLIVQNWDFNEEHVSNIDYDFLVERWTKPILFLADLPPQIQSRPLIVQAAKLRAVLAKMYAYLYTCPDARTTFGARLAHYYFLNEGYYSLSDLQSLRNREETDAGRGVARLVLGHQGVDVLASLETLVSEAREHILKNCHTCQSAAVRRCTLCGDADPVVMFDGGAVCPRCQSPFHAGCLALGCQCEHSSS